MHPEVVDDVPALMNKAAGNNRFFQQQMHAWKSCRFSSLIDVTFGKPGNDENENLDANCT